MSTKSRRLVPSMIYLRQDQNSKLETISVRRGLAKQVLLREAVDLLIGSVSVPVTQVVPKKPTTELGPMGDDWHTPMLPNGAALPLYYDVDGNRIDEGRWREAMTAAGQDPDEAVRAWQARREGRK